MQRLLLEEELLDVKPSPEETAREQEGCRLAAKALRASLPLRFACAVKCQDQALVGLRQARARKAKKEELLEEVTRLIACRKRCGL